jgi:hypothetical protein
LLMSVVTLGAQQHGFCGAQQELPLLATWA